MCAVKYVQPLLSFPRDRCCRPFSFVFMKSACHQARLELTGTNFGVVKNNGDSGLFKGWNTLLDF